MGNLLDAARRVAKSYPGGIDALAHRLDKHPATLRHELAGAPNYKLGAEDLEEITHLAMAVAQPNALEALHTLNTNCGQLAIPLPAALAGGDGDTMRRLGEVAKEFSDLVREVSARTADGDVSSNDLKAIDKELAELISSAHALRADLARQHAASRLNHSKE